MLQLLPISLSKPSPPPASSASTASSATASTASPTRIRRQGKIEWVHVRHEEAAAFAAGAEAHLTGELAVCAGSCGPGNLHLINGLFDCHRTRVPVLAIAAHIPSAEIGTRLLPGDASARTCSSECSHYCELVSSANQMPRVLEIAIRAAVGKRGVSRRRDSGRCRAASRPPTRRRRSRSGCCRPTPVRDAAASDLDRLAALLNGGERVTLLCGCGLRRRA